VGCGIFQRRVALGGRHGCAGPGAHAGRQLRRCFHRWAEQLEIPYDSGGLTGFLLRAVRSGDRRPLIILNNGADGLEKSVYFLRGASALARGYLRYGCGSCILARDGDGDHADGGRNATSPGGGWGTHCVRQGGYWAPRALAFERRIAAGVADPGVWDVSEPSSRNLPQFLRDLLDAGKKAEVDQV
jgi:hypothetical protein